MSHSKAEILAVMDNAAYSAYGHPPTQRFPGMLGDEDYSYHIGAKMRLFWDQNRWAMVIEHYHYMPRSYACEGVFCQLFPIGNCLPDYNADNNRFWDLTAFNIMSYGDKVQLVGDEDYSGIVPKRIATVWIRDKEFVIPRDMNEYKAIGIEWLDKNNLHLDELIRYLYYYNRNQFAAIKSELELHVPKDLPEMFTLDDWFHPWVDVGFN